MRRLFLLLLGSLLLAANAPAPHWREDQARRLAEWLEAARDDALPIAAAEAPAVRAAIEAGDQARLDSIATAAAVHLLRAHREGCCQAAVRDDWHIALDPAPADPVEPIAAALVADRLDALIGTTRPSHPFYYSLRAAYAAETDEGRRRILAANLDRWRWMPRQLGPRYLLVNAAAYEATLWQGREMIGRWRVIVGKTGTPTPIFAATVKGVTLNPWWDIPASIVAESVGALVRNKPAEAARKGYVVQDGRYRQKPGPNNALGRMKLVMPNPYSVYLHDTPAQTLFTKEVRAFSHGCIRVGDALGLATALLSAQPGWDRARVDQMVEAGRTVTLPLAQPLPVYITYFTAEPDGQGGVRYFPDVYGRDHSPPLDQGGDTACTL